MSIAARINPPLNFNGSRYWQIVIYIFYPHGDEVINPEREWEDSLLIVACEADETLVIDYANLYRSLG